MAEVAYWERLLVEKFVIKSKRERYLEFLKGPKNRKKILERLNHAFDYDPKCSIAISASDRSKQGLFMLLRGRYVADTCFFIADGNGRDGHELRLEDGIDELTGNHWGAILICPPKPIAVYKPENVGEWHLLEQPGAR